MTRWLVLTLLLAACTRDEDPPVPSDAGEAIDSGEGIDAGFPDSGEMDSGVPPEPYTITAFDDVRISSHAEDEHFQRARTPIDFREAPFAQVRMIVALRTTCFPFESWQTNPPPPGHNWPEDCDAFDRNFEIALHGEEHPPLELMRAITPFGGPLDLELDVTDVANGMPGSHELSVQITTWSDSSGQVSGAHGGWNVSVRFEVTPGAPPRNVLSVQPLFYTSVSTTSTSALAIEAPAGTASGRIELRATGHGGGAIGSDCIGPAEEFCRRSFDILVDGAVIETIDPWRTDCADFCTITHYGPASGGFDYCAENPTGAIRSVQAPRANWCPGSLTPPFIFEPAALGQPGRHTFEWLIRSYSDPLWPGIPPGGSWVLSATYFAYGD